MPAVQRALVGEREDRLAHSGDGNHGGMGGKELLGSMTRELVRVHMENFETRDSCRPQFHSTLQCGCVCDMVGATVRVGRSRYTGSHFGAR